MPLTRKAYRAAILHSIADPAEVGIEASYEYFEDGLLVVDNGQISALGHASELLPTLPALDEAQLQQLEQATVELAQDELALSPTQAEMNQFSRDVSQLQARLDLLSRHHAFRQE